MPLGAAAQTDMEQEPEVGARLAVSLDKKIAKGLHLSLEEELRFDNNLSAFDRFHTTLAINYKLLPYLKAGFGYALINGYSSNSSAFKSARHRFFADVTGIYRLGDWQLSLRERLQGTLRTGDFNEYQNPQTSWALKSRLKVAYKGLRRCEPYASFELRNTFNAPIVNAVYNDATDTWGYYNGSTFTTTGNAGWFLDGFSGVYVNRLRGVLGTCYRINRHSTLEVSLMADYSIDKAIDANGKGTKLKAYTRETGTTVWLCAGYGYSL